MVISAGYARHMAEELAQGWACRRCLMVTSPTWPDGVRQKIWLNVSHADLTDAGIIVFTGGTTGLPKIILRSFESWQRAFDAVDAHYAAIIENEEVFIQADPGHSMFAYGVLRTVHHRGCPVVSDTILPNQAMEAVVGIYGVPGHLNLWARRLESRCETRPNVRWIMCGGSFLSAAKQTRLRKCFPNAEIHTFYGAAELGYVTVNNVVLPDVTVQLAKSGQILVSSPFSGLRYTDGPFNTVGGFIATTDMAEWLPNDKLRVFGRMDQAVKVSDRLIFPEAIERCVLAVPGVDDCVVVIEPNTRRIRAAVTGAADQAVILNYCRDNLPSYMVPKYIEILPTIPLTPVGKPDLDTLANILANKVIS